MFTINSRPGRLLSSTAAVALASLTGVILGRAVLAHPEPTPPRLGDLRSAPNIMVAPALRFDSLADIIREADAIGLVHVEDVENVKETTSSPDLVNAEIATGRGDVAATVLDRVKGSEDALSGFAFDAFFEPGSNRLAVPHIVPPLVQGSTYLVFLKDGRLLYPGGSYRLHDGRLWYIGHWTGADSTTYPAGISGLTPDEAATLIRDNLTR